MSIVAIQQELRAMADPQKAVVLRQFFKTGPGQYGQGDRFLGIKIPDLRRLAKSHTTMAPLKVAKLLASTIHEQRMTALLIWNYQFDSAARTSDGFVQDAIYRLYLENTRWINNWDLVDVSAPHIPGAFLMDKDRSSLYELAGSASLWDRRIAIVATHHFIRHRQFEDTLAIAHRLLPDKEDLIHKAVGWMLREVGNRDQSVMEGFLVKHYRKMPRTMLRYAIEKLPEPRRRDYLKGQAI